MTVIQANLLTKIQVGRDFTKNDIKKASEATPELFLNGDEENGHQARVDGKVAV